MIDLIKLPDPLYKYITWEKDYHKRMISQNEIYFASNFNDPSDTRIPLRYDLGTNEQILELFRTHIKMEYPYLTEDEVEKIARDEIRENNIKNPQKIRSIIRNQFEITENKYGVFSVSKEYDNILMWSHYAKSHTGIVVRFDCKKLRSFIENDCVKIGLCIVWDQIDYQPKFPLLNPYNMNESDIVIKPLLIKYENWKYENEIRFIAFDYSNKTLNLPEGIIDRVFIGCKTSDKNINEIVKSTKNKNIETLRAKIKENDFGLDFESL